MWKTGNRRVSYHVSRPLQCLLHGFCTPTLKTCRQSRTLFHFVRFGTIFTMSTPSPIDSRTAAKRRAARRRQTRESIKRLGALLIVAVLVIGTVSTVFIGAPQVVNAPAGDATPTAGLNVEQLIGSGDEAAAKNDWASAVSYYSAYLALAQNATNADVHFKLGKAYLNLPQPNYLEGVTQLQQALSINPQAPFAQEAATLIDRNKDKAVPPGTITVTGTLTTLPSVVTGTVTVLPGKTSAPSTPAGSGPATPIAPASSTPTP